MIPADFHALHKSLTEEALDLSKAKGAEYASNSDALYNFKDQASFSCSKYDVLRIFLNKHLNSIDKSLRTLAFTDLACKKQRIGFNPDLILEQTSEPFRLRLIDAINYLALAEALVAEDSQKFTREDLARLDTNPSETLQTREKDPREWVGWEDPDGGK